MSEEKPRRTTSSGRTVREGLIIGVTQAVVFIALIVALTFALGNQQQKLLQQISNTGRAQVCVAALPLTAEGRSEAAVNSRCLIPNGMAPLDSDNDGKIEGTG